MGRVLEGLCDGGSHVGDFSPGPLDKYCQQLRRRARQYLGHLVYKADLRCRTEFWVEERRRQALWDLSPPAFSQVDAQYPMESVIRESAVNDKFWEQELEKHVTKLQAVADGKQKGTGGGRRGWHCQHPRARGQRG